jgi:Putative prokaryotic signal transducing protein
MISLLGRGFIGALIERLRGRLRPNGQPGVPARASAAMQWVAVESDSPPALAEMYRDVLTQHGIPAVVQSQGVGRGAMGGVPMNVRLLVPAQHAADARELLRGDDNSDEGDERERNVDGGER